jgi:CRISPR-associated endonuclease/helicase Cas3
MGESPEDVFREMLGPERAPYRHQLETAKSLLEGKSVVLRAPCGSGKSEAVLVPFLQGVKEKNERLPQHLIYSLPMRVLTENLAQRVKEKLHFDDVVAHHGMEVSDPLFEKSLIFTTIDQTVGAYCCVPLSASLGAGNIPAGAVVSAMLCFDEVHTYDYERALNSMLVILESSKKFNSPFAILSATLPDKFLSYCERHLGTKVIDVSEDEEDDIPCRKNREVKVQMQQDELTAEKIENCYHSAGKNAKILVVCNTVDKAQALYISLKNIFGLDSCFLLHSRFLPKDREKRESELLTAFQNPKKMCAITTQVCEVGLDISCDILLTEVSPIDSFIQRVGRCARRGGQGQVLVFNVKNCKPYQDELVDQSLKCIKKLDGECLRWNVEKQLVNDVLGDLYSGALNSQRYGRILGRLVEASFYRDRRRVEQSVREALTCKLTIHDNPESLGKDVLMMSGLSVDVNVLKGFYRKVKPIIWFVDTHKEDYESSSSLSARVSLVKDDEDIYPYGFFVLHPEFSNYDEYLGLRLGEIGENLPSVGYDQKQAQVFEYRKEPWVQHAEKSLACFDELKLNYMTEMRNISKALGIDKAHLETLIALCIAFHDIGKLNREWQMAAGALDSEPLAHAREMLKPPPHSAISAYSLMKILDDFTTRIHCRSLGIACFYALAHHHSVGTERIDPYSFILQWKEYVSNVLGKISVKYPLLQQTNPEDIFAKLEDDTRMPGRIPSLEFDREYVPYAFISRLLRLSDRRSQSA